METYDADKATRVWQRVQGAQQPQPEMEGFL